MARTAIAPTTVGGQGVTSADTVAAELTDGNSFAWAAGRHLYVANDDVTPLTVTVETPGTYGRQALELPNPSFVVPAGEWLLLPVLGTEYRRSEDGAVWVDYTGATASVTAAVLDL